MKQNQPIAIKTENLSKVFMVPHEKIDSLKSKAIQLFKRQTRERYAAFDDVNFEIKSGEFFGIVGKNGSGKSTLLKILARIYKPTKGVVIVNGSLATFIELGVGFNPDLSGRDNIFLNGAILGMTRQEINAKYNAILEFSELEHFIDQKVKNYSSGMQVRLAFAIAIQADADILLVDEVLAVGDIGFQAKCLDVFRELKKKGKTIVFVGHDMTIIREFCDRAILLNDGEMVSIGPPRKIINDYLTLTADEELASSENKLRKQELGRWGDRKIEINSCSITDTSGTVKSFYTEEEIEIVVEVNSHQEVIEPIFGIIIKNENGTSVLESNTLWAKIKTPTMKKGEKKTIKWSINNYFDSGKYTVSPAIAHRNGTNFYDWREDLSTFLVKKDYKTEGLLNFSHSISIK